MRNIDIHSAHKLAAPAKCPTASGTARIESTVKIPRTICAATSAGASIAMRRTLGHIFARVATTTAAMVVTIAASTPNARWIMCRCCTPVFGHQSPLIVQLGIPRHTIAAPL
jgi:hypothetical protein